MLDYYTELLFLRARSYRPSTGTFQSKDVWPPDYNRPLSLNRFVYVEANPINLVDPSGQYGQPPGGPNDNGEWEFRYRTLKELNIDGYIRAASHEYQVPKILLAASLMVQGSATYFYKYEPLQIAIGDLWDICYDITSFEDKIPVVSSIRRFENTKVQGWFGSGASLGVAQMTAEEVQKYLGVTCEDQCLIDNFGVSIRAMAAKIASIREDPKNGMLLVEGGTTPWYVATTTERYMLYATAQNNAATFSGTWRTCYFVNNKRGSDTDSVRDRWKCIRQQIGDQGNGYPNITYMLQAVKTLIKNQWYLSSSIDLGLWEEIAGYR